MDESGSPRNNQPETFASIFAILTAASQPPPSYRRRKSTSHHVESKTFPSNSSTVIPGPHFPQPPHSPRVVRALGGFRIASRGIREAVARSRSRSRGGTYLLDQLLQRVALSTADSHSRRRRAMWPKGRRRCAAMSPAAGPEGMNATCRVRRGETLLMWRWC